MLESFANADIDRIVDLVNQQYLMTTSARIMKLVENSVENIFPTPAKEVQYINNFAASPINIISVWQL
jgi:hypothetical protein